MRQIELEAAGGVEKLGQRFGSEKVVSATIAGESERTAPGRIVHRSFLFVETTLHFRFCSSCMVGPGCPPCIWLTPFSVSWKETSWSSTGMVAAPASPIAKTSAAHSLREQLVADTIELTDVLRARFHQDKICLVGHSWGTYLGMLVIRDIQSFTTLMSG